ncbi:unnamed protein product, partial [Strongylus vulgaris]
MSYSGELEDDGIFEGDAMSMRAEQDGDEPAVDTRKRIQEWVSTLDETADQANAIPGSKSRV